MPASSRRGAALVRRLDTCLPLGLPYAVTHPLHHACLAAAHGLVADGLQLQGIVAPMLEDLAVAGGIEICASDRLGGLLKHQARVQEDMIGVDRTGCGHRSLTGGAGVDGAIASPRRRVAPTLTFMVVRTAARTSAGTMMANAGSHRPAERARARQHGGTARIGDQGSAGRRPR
jgi:hypothetical protein